MNQKLKKVKEPLLFFYNFANVLLTLPPPVYLQIYFKYILNQHINHSLPFYYDEWNVNLDISKGITAYFKYQIHHEFMVYQHTYRSEAACWKPLNRRTKYEAPILKKKKKRYDFPNIFLNVRIFNIFLLNILKCKYEYNGHKWGLKVISVGC